MATTTSKALALLFALALACGLARAGEPLVLGAGPDRFLLNPAMGHLEDRGVKLSVHDVRAIPATAFSFPRSELTNFGFTESAYWLRAELRSTHPGVREWFLECMYPLLDRIDLYLLYPDGRIEAASGGDTLPFASRAVKHRFPTFRIALEPGETVTVLMRVKSEGALLLPFEIRTEAQVVTRDHEEQFVLGIYYGILLAMFIYNLMLYLSVRDISYLYYSLYIGSWTLMQMGLNGLAFEYLWPQLPGWNNISTPFFVGLIICCTVPFSTSFLQIRSTFPRLMPVYRAFFVLGVFVTFSAFFMRYAHSVKLAQASALLGCVIVFGTGVLCLRRGGMQARYFMLAWSLLLIGGALYVMQNSSLIPSVFITEYGLQIGSALEVLLFSFALAHRMKQLQEENVRIQREATEQLELRVQQRTAELDHALGSLSDAHQKLKDLSRLDGLTGIRNRACFNEKIAGEWQRGMRDKHTLCLLMIDIDHFKRINDTWGHQTGDVCLKAVAETLAAQVHRASDDVFRFGGEEFVAMLPMTDIKGAMYMGEVMRREIAALDIQAGGERIPLTISVGVACARIAAGQSYDALLGVADKALYEAKRLGRNRVCEGEREGEPAG